MKLYFNKAFTLIELLVVVSIMMILGLIIMTAILDARKESRDTARATTAEQLSLGIRLYKEAEGKYPVYPNGVEIGVGNPIDAQLAPFIKEIPKDPLTQGSGDEYEYWYYPNFLCNGERHDVVIVKQMEMGDNGNFDEVCGGGAVLPFETGLIPRAYAQNNLGGDEDSSAPVNSTPRFTGCSASVSPSTIMLPQTGSIPVSVNWGSPGEATINLIYPSGTSVRKLDYGYGPFPLSFDSSMPAGTYTVEVFELSRFYGGVNRCPVSFTVTPFYTQGTYYTQSTYEYVQSSYYSQGTYATEVENYTAAAYVVFIN